MSHYDNDRNRYHQYVFSPQEETFIERLHTLGPRGTVTRSIKLNPQNNVLCFADKLWFKVKRSSSRSMERFYVSVGLTFKLSEYNCIPYKKIWVSYVADGPIDLIQYLLGDMKHEDLRDTTTITYAYGRRDELASKITNGDFIPLLRDFFTKMIQRFYFKKLEY